MTTTYLNAFNCLDCPPKLKKETTLKEEIGKLIPLHLFDSKKEGLSFKVSLGKTSKIGFRFNF
jgi:hypothetical protein